MMMRPKNAMPVKLAHRLKTAADVVAQGHEIAWSRAVGVAAGLIRALGHVEVRRGKPRLLIGALRAYRIVEQGRREECVALRSAWFAAKRGLEPRQQDRRARS